MIIKKENRFVSFCKRFGLLIVVGVVVFGISLTFAITAIVNSNQSLPTSGGRLAFVSPMTNATVVKDFSDAKLQRNVTLKQWEAHLGVDLTSDDNLVYAVYDGTVSAVDSDHLPGNTIAITHANGFVSYYSSLAETPELKVGDKVKAGDLIGTASVSANSELDLGPHLHFMLVKDDVEVDPNNYLDLQMK